MSDFDLKDVTNAGFRQNSVGDWDVFVESPEGLRLYATCGYEQYAKDTAQALRAYATAMRMMPDFIEFTKKVRKEMDE